MTDDKTSLHLRDFEIIFHQLYSFRYSLWAIKRNFIFSSKNSHQSMDSLYSIFSKYCATYKFPDIAFKLNLFWDFILISCMFYSDLKNISILKIYPISCNTISIENQLLQWIHALTAVFGTNYEMPFDDSKQVPKWT